MAGTGSLIVVGTGIQWAGQTTLAAREAIAKAERVLFAVADAWAARWVRSINPAAESLPYPDDGRLRREIYQEIVEILLGEVRKGQRVCAVFYGHPGVLARASHEAVRRARAEGFSARMLPGVSALGCLFADLGVDPGRDGAQVFEATDFLIRGRSFDAHSPLVLFQIGQIGNLGVFDPAQTGRIRRGLTVLAEVLCRSFPAAHEATIYEASTHPIEAPRVEAIALGSLPWAKVSDLSTLYVPPIAPAPVDETMLARLGMSQGAARSTSTRTQGEHHVESQRHPTCHGGRAPPHPGQLHQRDQEIR